MVWQALTDYDGLAEFIPGLTENTCLERRANGARLRQVGAQDVAMGVKFSARVILDIHEFIAGVPTGLCSNEHNEDKFPLPRGVLCPRGSFVVMLFLAMVCCTAAGKLERAAV